MGQRAPFPVDRFWAKVEKRGPDECWPWHGAVSKASNRGLVAGYHGHMMTAPRAAFIFTHGGIRKFKFVCHSCDNPNCCNPRHLFLSDARGNQQDRLRKVRNGKLAPNRSPTKVRGVGARKRGDKWQANVTHRGKTYWRTFPPNTALDAIQEWRQSVLDSLRERADGINRHVAPSPVLAASVFWSPS